jgi:translocation and assembly module TamB
LLEPFSATIDRDAVTLTVARFGIGGGEARFSGAREGETVTADAQFTSVPVKPISAIWGYGDAQGRLSGEGQIRMGVAPQGRFSITAEDLAFTALSRGVTPADLSAEGRWDGATLRADGTISGLDAQPARFDATLPLRSGPDGGLVLSRQAPVSAHFVAAARAERLLAVLPVAEHSLSGALAVNLSASGTLDAPHLNGEATLADGTYESFQLGTRLQNIALKASADGAGDLAVVANATDGSGGRVALNGRVSLEGGEGPVGEATVTATSAYLVREDEYSARASGELKVAREAGAPARISGKLTTSEVRFDLNASLPAGVETIDVVEINRPASLGASVRPAPEQPDYVSKASLDITVNMPRGVYVQGRGLDAEWQGNLAVTGTVAAPAIGGRLVLVRGTAELLGRDFALREGVVQPDPSARGGATLRVVASHMEEGFTVSVTASGAAAAPELTWSSTPALPREEIVSRLYFGKGTPQLSAYEALQLAQLSGQLGQFGGGAGGILGFARRLTGLDVLQVQAPQGDTAGPRVAVGKYITDKIYVGAKRGGEASTGTVEVQVQVTPSISVEAETGLEAQAAGGVNWKWDY